MSNLWLKIKIWTKVVLVAVALIYLIVFSAKNSGQTATFWYFFNIDPVTTSALKLLSIAFASGVLVALLARTTFRTITQIRELTARQAAERREKEMLELRTKAGMLREKRGLADGGGDPTAPLV